MILKSWINKYQILLFILVLTSSCIEDKSIILNPENSESYELRSFDLDLDNSSSVISSNFNINSSPRLYLGENSYNGKSYIAIKIRGELLSNNSICNEENLNSMTSVSLKIPAIGDLDIFNSYHPDSSQIYEFDHDTFSESLVKAYILDSSLDLLGDELQNISIDENDILNFNLNSSATVPVTINNIFDYISIDLKDYIYSSYTQNTDDGSCDGLSYSACLCSDESSEDKDYNLSDCLEQNADCYWIGDPGSEISGCMKNINTNLVLNIENWCDPSSPHSDLDLLLEFPEPPSNIDLIELYSTESSNLYNSPYVFAKYTINDFTIEYKNKYDIDSIESEYLTNNFIFNNNSESNSMGTILGIDDLIINNIDNASSSSTCIVDNSGECIEEDLSNSLDTIIPTDYNDNLFNVDITLDDEYLDLYTDISFYFNNIYFAYVDEDPSLDQWQDCGTDGDCDIIDEDGTQGNGIWNEGESVENNNIWDWVDTNNNNVFDYLYDQHELFDDFGFADNCSDENELGNDGCSTENSIYNAGYEGNGIWDNLGIGNDDNGICLPGQCEAYEDAGYDQVISEYESGCFNEESGFGGALDLSLGITYNDIFLSYGGDISSLDTFTHSSGHIICGEIHWATECSQNSNSIINCRADDPNGDDYNVDPSNDNWLDCGSDGLCLQIDSDGSENNGIWDEGEGTEGNGKFDFGELFFDYGIDGLPDLYENINNDNWFDCNDDQTICSNDDTWDSSTMGNGIWNSGEGTEGNGQFDEGEPFFDYGSDQKQSYQEYKFNSLGKEMNLQYDSLGDNKEPFDDYGLDHCPNENELGLDESGQNQCCDGDNCNIVGEFEDPNQDNFLIDPNLDNYDIDSNNLGTENNGVLDWFDCNENQTICSNDDGWDSSAMGNGIWDLGEGEQWYDYGYDGVANNLETNYLNNYADLSLGTNLYLFELPANSFNLNEPEIFTFDRPIFSTNDQVGLWISSIERIEENSYRLYINVNVLEDIKAFQFQLKHLPISTNIETVVNKSLYMFSPEFNDENNNNFTESNEIIADGEKYILDSSIYNMASLGENDSFDYNSNDLNISYGYGIESSLDFSSSLNGEAYTLQSFIDENQNSNISNEFTNLVLYFDTGEFVTDNSQHNIKDNSNIVIKYFDTESGQNVLINNISAKIVSSDMDSLSINVGSLIQKYINNEINYENIILGSNGELFNFSNISIIDARLDIFYSK